MMFLESSAVISPCGRFRYRLYRRWAPGALLLYIMLNPSTADGEVNDPTIRRCVWFASNHGYGAMLVVNLFAFRATKPADLKRAEIRVGPDNDLHIREAVKESTTVCVAWGAHAAEYGSRPSRVLDLLRELGVEPVCLGCSRDGLPRHPLMLPNGARFEPYGVA